MRFNKAAVSKRRQEAWIVKFAFMLLGRIRPNGACTPPRKAPTQETMYRPMLSKLESINHTHTNTRDLPWFCSHVIYFIEKHIKYCAHK